MLSGLVGMIDPPRPEVKTAIRMQAGDPDGDDHRGFPEDRPGHREELDCPPDGLILTGAN